MLSRLPTRRDPRGLAARIGAAALLPLAAAALTACGSTMTGSPLSVGGGAATTTAAAPSGATFCSSISQLGARAKQVTSKQKVEAIDMLGLADAYDKVAAVAPKELQPGLLTLARDYRLVGRGDTTMAKVSPEMTKVSNSLTEAITKVCVPGQ